MQTSAFPCFLTTRIRQLMSLGYKMDFFCVHRMHSFLPISSSPLLVYEIFTWLGVIAPVLSSERFWEFYCILFMVPKKGPESYCERWNTSVQRWHFFRGISWPSLTPRTCIYMLSVLDTSTSALCGRGCSLPICCSPPQLTSSH